jgi:outer membrane protein TolC
MAAAGIAEAAMTAEDAVRIALQTSSDVIRADAAVLDARGGLYSGYAGILPSLTASLARDNRVTEGSVGFFGTLPVEQDQEAHGTTPSLGVSWNALDLSALTNFQAARAGLTAARHSREAARNDVVLATLSQFYQTVQTYHLASVASGALRVARDNERRARALFEVGSVSRSDLLKAQVQTAQSELDSLTAAQAVVNQRIALASRLGIAESTLGDIDTVLTAETRDYDEAAILAEAAAGRPDVQAAEADLRSAKASRLASRLGRLPYVTVSGGAAFDTETRTTSTTVRGIPPFIPEGIEANESTTDRSYNWRVALNWDLFDGLRTDAAGAAAEARLRRAQDTRDVLVRNLTSEVHQAVLQYREATEKARVARRAVESADENLNLTQQKYNVGSATILELVDAQVQATRAAADGVVARAAIRVAEARLERVRGRGAR